MPSKNRFMTIGISKAIIPDMDKSMKTNDDKVRYIKCLKDLAYHMDYHRLLLYFSSKIDECFITSLKCSNQEQDQKSFRLLSYLAELDEFSLDVIRHQLVECQPELEILVNTLFCSNEDNTPNFIQTSSLALNALELDCDAFSFLEHHKVYPMESYPRGYFLLINIEEFLCEDHNRPGSGVDLNNLQELFLKLDFKVIIKKNLNRREFLATIDEVCKLDHSSMDSFFCFIGSHGKLTKNVQYVMCHDHNEVDVNYILHAFNECKQLLGKPKIFLFQMCRGDEVDYGSVDFTYKNQSFIMSSTEEFLHSVDLCTESDANVTHTTVGLERLSLDTNDLCDTLVIYPTVQGFCAIRDAFSGSWFASVLCAEIQKAESDVDLINIFQRVNKCIRNKQGCQGEMQALNIYCYKFNKQLFLKSKMYAV